MRSRALAALAVGAAIFTSGCVAAGPPQITFFADGTAIELEPVRYCDVRVAQCEARTNAKGTLSIRPGQPVQISVPPEVAESPWLVNTQSVTPDGEVRPVEQEVFLPGKAFAFTARPGPDERLLVVEVQQLGAAYVDDGTGGRQLLARGLWSLELRSRVE